MNEFYLPNIGYNNRRDTQKLCLAYTKDTLKMYLHCVNGKLGCCVFITYQLTWIYMYKNTYVTDEYRISWYVTKNAC